jgi:hypothetical protein
MRAEPRDLEIAHPLPYLPLGFYAFLPPVRSINVVGSPPCCRLPPAQGDSLDSVSPPLGQIHRRRAESPPHRRLSSLPPPPSSSAPFGPAIASPWPDLPVVGWIPSPDAGHASVLCPSTAAHRWPIVLYSEQQEKGGKRNGNSFLGSDAKV